ncbi:MAG TPA: pilus assembly protein TadG-related protein [Geomonas sp.]|nr:pilus assembly protein TadG-related protein [Geomonas sp.]
MKPGTRSGNERGSVLLVLLAWLLVFFFLAGLAIDVSRLFLVRVQLQNAANAAALAGAAVLYGNPVADPPPGTPQWTTAESEARRYAGLHTADWKTLKDCRVDLGFWNISSRSFQIGEAVPPGVCFGSQTPCTSRSDCVATRICRQVQVPAVKVTLTKGADSNGGALQMPFARIFGFGEIGTSATALAFSGTPGAVQQGVLFPFAIKDTYKDCYVNGVLAGQGAVNLETALPAACGDTDPVGQWTNLSPNNAASTDLVRGYIDYLIGSGNMEPPPAVAMNGAVKEVSGNKDKLYQATASLIATGRGPLPGIAVLMPVVDQSVGATMTVRGFVGVQLTSATPLQGRFLNYYPLHPGPARYGGERTSVIPAKPDKDRQ